MARAEHLVDPADAWNRADGAQSYATGRPSYPVEAVRFAVTALGLGPASRAIDLGAGTGKFTALLAAETEARVVAVEPQPAMRATFADSLPAIEVRDGSAEALPFADGSVDAVFAATAFHWFDPERALPELHRVLRPGGGLGLLWMERDERVPWVQAMTDAIRWDSYRPYGVNFDWHPIVESGGRFEITARAQFPYVQLLDRAQFAERVRSISYIATLPPDRQAAVLARTDALVAGFTEPFELPYQCDVVIARRREPGAQT